MTASDRPRLLTAAGLVVCGAGIGILKLAGVDMPPVPPGLVIVLVAAAAVVFLPWRWAPVLGVLAGLAEAAGFFASGSAAGLLDGTAGEVLGTWVRLIGIVIAVVAGAVAVGTASRSPARSRR